MKFSRLVEANSMKTQEAAVPLMNHEKKTTTPYRCFADFTSNQTSAQSSSFLYK
jgi:hypothetical protein